MAYLQQMFRYPTSFETALYASQLPAGRGDPLWGGAFPAHQGGICMGAISLAAERLLAGSFLGFHRLYRALGSALHLLCQALFAPVLLSCCEEGMLTQNTNVNAEPYKMEKSVRFSVSNETMEDHACTVRWSLRDRSGHILREETVSLVAPKLQSVWLDKVELPEADPFRSYVSYELLISGVRTSGAR